jgi:hypothetical protein
VRVPLAKTAVVGAIDAAAAPVARALDAASGEPMDENF